MYARILNNKLLQLSDRYIEGYKEVIEEEKPEEKEGYEIVYDYQIKEDNIYKVYSYREIEEYDSTN